MSTETCPACQRPIPADAPMGLCLACLAAGSLLAPVADETYQPASSSPPPSGPSPSLPPGSTSIFGKYELLELLARGGMGVVYKARNTQIGHTVALKMIRGGALASEAEVHRFHYEAAAASELDHPNIVPIYDVGEYDGRHYFTMKLMKGGTLAGQLARYEGDPRGAAALVATIAMAVHYGHERGILHRDLKPANILLDGEGRPHVADFGIARRIDKDSLQSLHPLDWGGTPPYMAPEPEDRRAPALTTASDVFSLGVILYELITGERPFKGDDPIEIRENVRTRAPTDPRRIAPSVDRDLATICLKCLEKDPPHRYRSAEELAQDLRRYLRGEPVLARPLGAFARAWRWCLRRPYTAALIAEAALSLVIVAIVAISVAAAQESDRRDEVLRANAFAARWVAGTVLYKLRHYQDIVTQAATDFPPALFEPLRRGEVHDEREGMQRYCEDLGTRHRGRGGGPPTFNSWFILAKDGKPVARWHRSEDGDDWLEQSYAFRDYFKGAWRLADARQRSAYVSRAMVSEPAGGLRFGVSSPIYDDRGEPIGILVAMSNTGATLGTLQFEDPHDKRHIAMVVAPLDNTRDQADAPLPKDYVILLHDSLGAGKMATLGVRAAVSEAVALADRSNPNRGLDQLPLPGPEAVASDERYCDPVMDGPCDPAKPHAGRWLAGFAPVGNTGFVAIVETPRDAAAQPNQTLARRLGLWGGLPFAVGSGLIGLALVFARRRSLRGGRSSGPGQPLPPGW